MKKFLEKLIREKKAKAEELRKQIKTAETADEVRSLGDTLQAVLAELKEAEEQLAKLDDDSNDDGGEGANGDDGNGEGGQRSNIPANAQLRGATNILGAYAQNVTPEKRTGDALDSLEYRQAFMRYVQTGEWNYEKRADETLLTSDIGKIIPNTIMNEFIKELKVYGNLYNRVRKLNVRGGVEFPIEELVPQISWIAEDKVSDTQKAPEYKNSVMFGYHIVEARISQSLLSQVVSLPVLESEIAKLLAEAFIKEFDRIILNGTGEGQPLGILKDKRIPEAQIVTMTDADLSDWKKWRTKLFAKIPLAYRSGGLFCMTADTWESKIMTLADNNNNPLYSETYDAQTGETTCRFAGRETQLVEPDILTDISSATAGDVIGLYFKPDRYAINSNMQIAFKRWFDDNKNKWVNKGLAILDGKLLDVNGVYIIKKG